MVNKLCLLRSPMALCILGCLSSLACAFPSQLETTYHQDNGKDCEINSICFAMDQSGSVAGFYPDEQRFVVSVSREIASRTKDTQFSAYGFSGGPVKISGSTKDLEGVFIPEVNAPVTPSGSTNMYSGLNSCFNEIKGQKGNRVIVLVTDGVDNGFPTAESKAPEIKNNNVAIVTVGIGSGISEDYLRGLATNPSLFISSTFSALPKDVVKVADSSCDAPEEVPEPQTPEDLCAKAYDDCDFKFKGRKTVPTFKIRRNQDRPFTPKIVSRIAGERLGVLNTNGVISEFINADGSAQLITKALVSPRFRSTHFKPFYIKGKNGSGIGHQTFTGNQKKMAKNRCVRVFFTTYQVLTGSKPPFVKDNVNVDKSDNKCVVFKTN